MRRRRLDSSSGGFSSAGLREESEGWSRSNCPGRISSLLQPVGPAPILRVVGTVPVVGVAVAVCFVEIMHRD